MLTFLDKFPRIPCRVSGVRYRRLVLVQIRVRTDNPSHPLSSVINVLETPKTIKHMIYIL